jgi:hypothetical protein
MPSKTLDLSTHRESHSSMLVNITKIAIDHHALRTQILCPRAHQAAPTRRVHTLGLRDEDNAVFLDPIGEVLGCFGSCGVAGFDHLNSVSGPEDLGFTCLVGGREHLDAVKIAAVGDL